MKIRFTIFLLLFNLPNANADSAAAAVAAVIEANVKFMDNIQLELGGGAALVDNTVSPEIHLGLNYHYLKRFNIGVSSDISIQNKANVPNFNFGVVAGVKNFNSVLGQHYYNLNVGGSIFENGDGVYVEPQINFILNESSPARLFWVLHTVGVSATLALRHIFVQSNSDFLEDSNTLLLRMNFYLKQRKRRLK